MTSINDMNRSYVDVEDGVDGVERFNLEDGGEGEARCG